jgi:regulator of sirC expression with transglutaminase-like and TPR domain
MLIARIGDERADPHACAARLDAIAEAARDHAGETLDPDRLAAAVDYQLFSILGFQGNEADYGDPGNSYLHRVLERRTGIPITLSLLYMEVGQRIGLHCEGVGYPGHFIVRYERDGGFVYVDPFHQGARLDEQELLAGLRSKQLGGATPESFLSAVTRRQILQRMLTNLRVGFAARGDLPRLLLAVEMLLRLEPWNASLVGLRGMVRYRLGNAAEAVGDLERYVGHNHGDAANAGAAQLLRELRQKLGG